MAALVQSFPQQSPSVTMLQTRPSSASGSFQNTSQAPPHRHHHHQPHQHQHQAARPAQMPRNLYHPTGGAGGGGVSTYRGQTSSHAPVAPYAFTSTPNANMHQTQSAPHLKQEHRTLSAPIHPSNRQSQDLSYVSNPHRHHPSSSSSAVSSAAASSLSSPNLSQAGSKDDSALASSSTLPALDFTGTGTGSSAQPATASPTAAARQAPDRYRRPHRRGEHPPQPSGAPNAPHASWGPSATPSGSGMATVGHLYSQVVKSGTAPTPRPPPSYGPSSTWQAAPPVSGPAGVSHPRHARQTSVDDMSLYRKSGSDQSVKDRRKSISSLDAPEFRSMREDTLGGPGPNTASSDHTGRLAPSPNVRPSSSRGRNDSAESLHSSRSNSSHPSSRDAALSPLTANPVSAQTPVSSKMDSKSVTVPARGSSDAIRRLGNPSPLSKPMSMSPELQQSGQLGAANPRPGVADPASSKMGPPVPDSPAAQQLAALNEKDAKKKGKSRLRRAFSFGSAAELRRASAENNMNNAAATTERAKLRKERYQDEREAEQEAIARKQEEGGIGEGIYSGQGNFFTGSTDNLSISSTASSASVMIRKMGKGMKKSTRSLVGLFRPKSIIGGSDGSDPEPSVGPVSMVTVEAEREKVNVNANPHDQVGGGTGFPKLERNSIETVNATAANEARGASRDGGSADSITSRRSIVGGERERAEVLAAVKKGILKRSGTDSGNSSPVTRPVDSKSPDFVLPSIPHFSDTPRSSAPSTPEDDRPAQLGHRRTDSVTIEGEDYFMSLPRFAMGESKSAPNTPQSIARNISFSPRIQFHDTWPSGEYDRRGEIATCNRLTPMLAQQIKEELNSFKMEMEVHEQSKVYTHFF
ncbi:MAG: bud neck involved protein [Sclerophora amabilis]|nr:MAG: bud neck involved protein [Sclerophora amabilis]